MTTTSKIKAVTIVFILIVLSIFQTKVFSAENRVHCVVDISHDFSFYFDGRFGRNYVGENGTSVQNWGTLHKYDLTNANLLVLQSSASPCMYTSKDIEAVRRFLAEGGGVLVLGDFATFRNQKDYPLNAVAKRFGAEFVNTRAEKPLVGRGILKDREIESYSPKVINLNTRLPWTVLARDSKNNVVAASRSIGKGRIMVMSRSLCGHKPDASDPINDSMWKTLFADLASGKTVSADKKPRNRQPENEMQKDRLPIQYSDYMKPYADAIYEVYDKSFPFIQQVMGVPPSDGMLARLILLPTGGGGFSSGSAIGLAAWWGDFPEKQYGMVELISHESTHSWVHPFTEPMWNEGIATYVGIRVGQLMGLNEDADKSLNGWIKSAKKHDPDMTNYDIANGREIPHAVMMAKPMWIFEQLRKEQPDIVAKYFQAKRKYAKPDIIEKYTADDSVAVLSTAMGRDLFPWFKSLGITVDRSRARICK